MTAKDKARAGLTPVPLSRHQAGVLRRAYAGGDVLSNPMLNLLGQSPMLHLTLMLTHLPAPPIDPVHFYFTGNRRYANQLVTNGESYALLLCQALSPSERKRIPFTMFRLEVIQTAHLPFLKVAAAPHGIALRRLALDHIQYTVQKFRDLPLEAKDRMGWLTMFDQLDPSSPLSQVRAAILDGANPHAVWAEFEPRLD